MAGETSLHLKKCIECGGAFSARKSWQRFCSPTCKAAFHIATTINCFVRRHLLTVAEASTIAHVTPAEIRRRICTGEVRSTRLLGRRLLFRKDFI